MTDRSPQTLADLQAAIDTLASIMRVHGNLPAPHVHLSPNHPNRIEFSVHDGLEDFEAWREALDIPTGAVTYSELPGLMYLQAETVVGRATVILTGYAPLVASTVATAAPTIPANTWAGRAA